MIVQPSIQGYHWLQRVKKADRTQAFRNERGATRSSKERIYIAADQNIIRDIFFRKPESQNVSKSLQKSRTAQRVSKPHIFPPKTKGSIFLKNRPAGLVSTVLRVGTPDLVYMTGA